MSSVKSKSQTDLEWERRVLCSDEACIGTIGPDGKCRECGKPYEGELPDFSDQIPEGDEIPVPSDTDETEISDQPEDTDDGLSGDEAEIASADDEWERRTLCSDERCIGVVGPDGNCKECGKPYEG